MEFTKTKKMENYRSEKIEQKFGLKQKSYALSKSSFFQEIIINV